ncbi:MAG: TonB-dependent receptor [Dysgonamonadaceae bacterium]|nr:TonB-dependent receptor [Dysgonamonadaceae bacterium]
MKILSLITLVPVICFSQRAVIQGTVIDSEGLPVELVNVGVRGSVNGAFTDGKGKYSLTVAEGDSLTLVFSCLGYNKTQRIIPKVEGNMTVNVSLRTMDYDIGGVTVTGRQKEPTMMQIETKDSRLAVDATGGSIESFVVTAGTGVSSSNELSTQYSVRGGNYNENIVYVNGIEIYRPVLIRSGQQEGLSFINPDLTDGVSFSSGGFEARYGDRMSSVLDVNYKKPKALEGGFSGSMLGGSAYIGNASGHFSQITGVRYKRGTTLLNTLDTKGDYEPSALDVQTFMTYAVSPGLNLNVMGNYSDNAYDFYPGSRQTSWGNLQVQKSFEVYYAGAERDRFRTLFGATTVKYDISENADIALQVSAFQNTEQENYDIEGEYWISNILDDDNKDITGTGHFIEHARSYLKSNVVNTAVTGSIGLNHHTVRYSLSYQKEDISDRIREWKLQDSMGYSLPVSDEVLQMKSNLFSGNSISSSRFSGYMQDTYSFRNGKGLWTLTAGLRGSYWDFNREFIVSPRASLRFIPSANQRLITRFSTGLYYQAPFYKEFRKIVSDEYGNQNIALNQDIKSQRSIHFVLGGDYNFRVDDRPFKFTTELYYKKMDNLVPYHVNNVRIQYYGENISSGHATGIDLKLFGQFVPETDSWLNFSLMQARQTTFGGVKIPMPTDQLYNFSLYFNDYMPGYRRIQLNLRAIWADGLPFTIPGYEYTKYIRTSSYRRVDIGMTYRLWDSEKDTGSSFFSFFKNIWAGADVFNLLDINNVSSYSWFSDVEGLSHAVPDRLTGRQINFKLIAEF